MRSTIVLLLCAMLHGRNFAADSSSVRMEVRAVRLTGTLTIDGRLSEDDWQRASEFATFVQRDPVENGRPSQKTVVRLAFDDAALYVGARMYDDARDSIVARLGRKDIQPNSDYFCVYLDPYYDRRSGFYFGLDAAGTMFDGVLYNDSWNDNTWDGVWEGKVTIDEHGWTAEMRIPFSQLRFQQREVYVWGINFERDIARRNEADFVVFTPKNGTGFVSRFVDLLGLHDIVSPRQIEILPYVTTRAEYMQHRAGDPFNPGARYVPRLGADIKMGLGTNLTLDGTINPDFGQVEVDPAVVNLSDVESFFEEKRPFFIEGSSLFRFGQGGASNYWSFNWSNPNFFYSRRIGRAPQGSLPSADFTDVPVGTKILGAAKLTGKPGDGWSIGTLHAVTAREFAQLQTAGQRSETEVEPLTYYGVFRGQREFDEGKQGLGIMATAVGRRFSDERLRDQLNGTSYFTGLDGWTFLDQEKSWVISAWGAGSYVRGDRVRILALQENSQHYLQRPDAKRPGIDTTATSFSGYAGRFYLVKQRGNVIVNGSLGVISPRFDNNDLGFLYRADVVNMHVGLGYQWTEPTRFYRRLDLIGAFFQSYDFDGNRTWQGVFARTNIQLPNFSNIGLAYAYNPATVNTRRTRGGPVTLNYPGYELDLSLESDNTRNLVFQVYSFMYKDEELTWNVNPNLEFRPSSNVSVSFGPMFERDADYAQWVGAYTDPTATTTFGKRYIHATLSQSTLSATIRLNWTFTPQLSLQIFLQPLISAADYRGLKELSRPGSLDFQMFGTEGSTLSQHDGQYTVDHDGSGPAPSYTFSNPDFNLKSLRGNAVLRWEYLPGSTLYLVWTQSRYQSDGTGEFQFGRSIRQLVDVRPDNIFMVKLSYWWNK